MMFLLKSAIEVSDLGSKVKEITKGEGEYA
jgi:hypothetical protein